MDNDDRELDNMVDIDEDESSSDGFHALTPSRQNPIIRIRNKIWVFMDVPTSSKPALVWGIFIIILILLSILVFMIETMPEYYTDPPAAFFWIETVVVAIFTFEFITRFLTTPSYKKFVLGPLNWIDFLSILPYYIELAFASGPGLAWVRVLRLARVFRIFKLGRYQEGFTLFYLTFRSSLTTMALGIVFLCLGMIIFSSFMFYAEQTYATFDDDEEQWTYNNDTILAGEKSFFQSIPHTFWWCIVTMTTVGYGDTYPISPLGKTVAGITFLGGLAIIAFPIAILGSKFLDLYLENEEKKELRKQALAQKKEDELQQTHAEKLAAKYPFFPVPARDLLHWKTELDEELSNLEEKVQALKSQAKTISRALELLSWERNPALLDIEFVHKVTNADKETNLPFK